MVFDRWRAELHQPRRATDPAPGASGRATLRHGEQKTGDFHLCGLFDPANATGNDEHAWRVRATFSGTSINWSTPVVVKVVARDRRIHRQAVDRGHSMSGNVYVTYTRFTLSQDSILFSRSRNQGVTWGRRSPSAPPPRRIRQGLARRSAPTACCT